MWLIAGLLARPLALGDLGDPTAIRPAGPTAPGGPTGAQKMQGRDLPEDIQSVLAASDTVSLAANTSAGAVPAQPLPLAAAPTSSPPPVQQAAPVVNPPAQPTPETVPADVDVPPDVPPDAPAVRMATARESVPTASTTGDAPAGAAPEAVMAASPPAAGPSPSPLTLTLQTILDSLRPAPASAEQIDTAVAGLARLWNSGEASGKITPGMVDILHNIKAAMASVITGHFPSGNVAYDNGHRATDKVRWLQRALYVADIFDGDFSVHDIGNHADMENYDIDGRFGSHTKQDLADFQARAGLAGGRFDTATRKALLQALTNDELPPASAPAESHFVPPSSYPGGQEQVDPPVATDPPVTPAPQKPKPQNPPAPQPQTPKVEQPAARKTPVASTPVPRTEATPAPADTTPKPEVPVGPPANAAGLQIQLATIKLRIAKSIKSFDTTLGQAAKEAGAAATGSRAEQLLRLTAADRHCQDAAKIVERLQQDASALEALLPRARRLPTTDGKAPPLQHQLELDVAAARLAWRRALARWEELSDQVAERRREVAKKAAAKAPEPKPPAGS